VSQVGGAGRLEISFKNPQLLFFVVLVVLLVLPVDRMLLQAEMLV
jgi:hypothetical protein